jgi:hypothetical protein
MSFRECITNGENEGKLSGDQAAKARGLFDELEAEYAKKMDPIQAGTQAAKDTFDALQKEAIEKKRVKLLQIRNWQKISFDLNQYAGGESLGKAAQALLDRDEFAKYSNVEARRKAVLGQIYSKMDDVLATFRRRGVTGGLGNKAMAKDLVREVFGEDTGSAAAKELAQSWSTAADYARQRFNAAGGAIPKRKDWGMPQIHDSMLVRKAGREEWTNFIRERLDLEKMIDERTGLKFTPERLELALAQVFDSIATEGWNKVKPSGAGSGRSMAGRHQDHRFLAFKNADSWMEYQEKFGNPEPFVTMVNHLEGMSRDISMMEILGPNPNATVRYIHQTVMQDAKIKEANQPETKMVERANKELGMFDSMYAILNGSTASPVDGTVARGFAGLRQILQSAQLGAAAVSALTDINFQRIAAQTSGIPAADVIKRVADNLVPLNIDEKGRLASRLGLIAENWTSVANAQARFVGDMTGPEITRRISDTVMRITGLSPWTQAGRWAFGMEFMGYIADNAAKKFKDLDQPLQDTLNRYGIGEGNWEVIRTSGLYEHEGATFLRPEEIALRTDLQPGRADDLATRFLEMIQSETEFAVPSASIRGRVMLVGESRPGTFVGEISRSFAMYKNFPVTLLNTHVMRAVNAENFNKKGAYFADLVISTTLFGALAMQLKEITKGRDPRTVMTPEFWGAALLQGGGLGILGDFLFNDVNRFGGGLEQTIAGPVVGFLDDTRRLTIGNVQELATGKDTHFMRELISYAGRYTPGSSIWYLRLALERQILDRLQIWGDPDAKQRMREIEARYRRETGQRYWWSPGDTEPERGPDFEKLTAEPPPKRK